MPVPVREAVCGLFVAPSVTVSDPLAMPEALGVKVTFIVQDALAASEPKQLFTWEKGPVAAMLLMVRDVPELFARVKLRATLFVSRTVFAKVRLVGESVAVICGGGGELLPPLLPPPQPLSTIAIAQQQTTQTDLRI
jgi:hypothetical protein